ncbi:type II toxin-antitoxin system HicA family toxin [Kribbella catacumbae]|uniref:type II toxin-antitoxin system HicA family toxin n=1 Tax=Kribbella catacumbae TaxID=460086 RepID=UPI00037EFDD4|nr:type II toxin-antitoxin system HicA family toxin [Kribbella catacumbae]
MPKKNRDAAKELKAAGFEKQPSKRGKGSHEVWKDKSGKTVTVPTHGEIPTGTWSAIQRQAGLKSTPAKKTDDAEQAQRLASDGVAKPGGQARGTSSDQQSTRRHGGRGRGRGRGD